MAMPGLADVFQRYGGAYLDRFGADLLPSHRRAIEDILHCRTEVLGGHLLQCDHCGQEHYVYHSCRNRSCPKCHHQDTEAWLAERRLELLPVPYFHVVFTVPHELGELIRRHQQALYDILLRAAAQSLMQLAADPHYVGGRIGVLCVLHTWTRTLAYHPHVHCLVPAGGVSADRTAWRSARTSSLVPVHALSSLFRGLFLALVRQERPDLTPPESVRTKGWVVYCKPAVQGTEQVLHYLGRYVHRIALTNSRILSLDDEQVCFRYQDSQTSRWHTMTLPAQECIRRFLPHVLPQGFHKVRYYGLWSPVHRSLLHQLQLWLATQHPPTPRASPDRESQSSSSTYVPLQAGQLCPHCGQDLLVVTRQLPRHQRGPP
jgi:hypothetical protein